MNNRYIKFMRFWYKLELNSIYDAVKTNNLRRTSFSNAQMGVHFIMLYRSHTKIIVNFISSIYGKQSWRIKVLSPLSYTSILSKILIWNSHVRNWWLDYSSFHSSKICILNYTVFILAFLPILWIGIKALLLLF